MCERNDLFASRTIRSWKAMDGTAFSEAIADSLLGKAFISDSDESRPVPLFTWTQQGQLML